MDKRTERRGKSAAEWLQEDLDGTEQVRGARLLVDASALSTLLDYVKALEEVPVKVTKDVYLRGEWACTILEVDLTEDQVALLRGLGERSALAEATVEVEDHNPEYPLPNWMGHTRK